jgi:hypothetical protein
MNAHKRHGTTTSVLHTCSNHSCDCAHALTTFSHLTCLEQMPVHTTIAHTFKSMCTYISLAAKPLCRKSLFFLPKRWRGQPASFRTEWPKSVLEVTLPNDLDVCRHVRTTCEYLFPSVHVGITRAALVASTFQNRVDNFAKRMTLSCDS